MDRDRQSGFMLIEVMIAAVLLVIGALGFMGAIFASQMIARQTKEQNRANAALVTAVEEFRREAAENFDEALNKHSGETTYERTTEVGADGSLVTVDRETRTTTTEVDLNGDPIPVDSKPAVVAANPVEVAPNPEDLKEAKETLAKLQADAVAARAVYDAAVAEASRALAAAGSNPGFLRKAQTFVDAADSAKRNLADKMTTLATAQATYDALASAAKSASSIDSVTPRSVAAPAPAGEVATPVTDNSSPGNAADRVQAEVLYRELISLYGAGRISKQDAMAKWKAAGYKMSLLVSKNGLAMASTSVATNGTKTTQTVSVGASGARTETVATIGADGTAATQRWITAKNTARMVRQRRNADGNKETTIETTTVADPSVVKAGVVDLGMIAKIGDGAKFQMNLLVDETKLDPPVDLNGDGDYLDTNVKPTEMTAGVMRVAISWQSRTGQRQVETTTIIARNSIGATYR